MTRDEHAFADILEEAEQFGPLSMAVAHPCSQESLMGAVEAADHGIISPILIAPLAKLEKVAADKLAMNDIADVTFKLAQPLFVDPYLENRGTGAFIVIDESSNNTVGAGMIL